MTGWKLALTKGVEEGADQTGKRLEILDWVVAPRSVAAK